MLVVCPECDTTNRIPDQRLEDAPVCGRCGEPLFQGEPVALTKQNFDHHLTHTEVPVVVDFWAAWCGPCKQMAPTFEKAALAMEPHVRLAKLDTETEQAIAARYNIRSIPTLIAFKDGREIGRQSGAMPLPSLTAWVQQVTQQAH